MNRQHTIGITLDGLDALFAPPPADPLAGRFETTSGIEQLLQQAASLPRPAREHCGISIALPAPLVTPDMAERLARAIAGYCGERLADIERSLRQAQREGRQALWLGLGFLAACLLLSSAVSNLTILPEFIRRLFGEGFNIAGWVGLWRPIELLLYDSWPFRRDLRLLRSVAKMPVTVLPAATPATAAATT